MDRNRGLDINALRQQIEDLFEDFFPSGGARRPGGRPGGDQPQHLPVNVVESEDQLVVSAPVPGLNPEDIEISVRGQSLSIRAQRHNQAEERPNYLRREWSFGPYQRNIDLPFPVDADRSAATYRHGVISITLPRTDASRPRTIHLEPEEQAVEQPEPQPEAPVETSEAAATTEAPETAETVTVGEGTSTEAAAGAADDETRSSFYMRPPSGRRGRGRGRGGRSAPAPAAQAAPATEPTSDETQAEPEPEMQPGSESGPEEAGVDIQVQGGPEDAVSTEPEFFTGMESPAGEAATPAEGEGAAEEQSAPAGEAEAPSDEIQVPLDSAAAHTTTAGQNAPDISEQRGPSTAEETASAAPEPAPAEEVTGGPDPTAEDVQEARD